MVIVKKNRNNCLIQRGEQKCKGKAKIDTDVHQINNRIFTCVSDTLPEVLLVVKVSRMKVVC